MSGTAPVTGTATRPGGARPGVPGHVAAVLRAPFTRRAWAEFGYAMAGLPLGVAGFAFTVATLAAGAALTLTVLERRSSSGVGFRRGAGWQSSRVLFPYS